MNEITITRILSLNIYFEDAIMRNHIFFHLYIFEDTNRLLS